MSTAHTPDEVAETLIAVEYDAAAIVEVHEPRVGGIADIGSSRPVIIRLHVAEWIPGGESRVVNCRIPQTRQFLERR